jgi:hypothetical protein
MDRVWLVRQDDYDSSTVVGAYSSKEKAQTVADHVNASLDDEYYQGYGGEAVVRELKLDVGWDEAVSGLNLFSVWMHRDGSLESPGTYLCNFAFSLPKEKSDFGWHLNCTGKGGSVLGGKVWAKSKEHAVELANEVRLAMIASGEWE